MSYRITGMFGNEKRYWRDIGNRCGAGSAWVEDADGDITEINHVKTAMDWLVDYIPESISSVVTIDGVKHWNLLPDTTSVEEIS